jgi:hypothetical protein
MAVNRQWHDKHVSLATDTHSTMEEVLEMAFSMLSVSRLYSESHWEKLDSQELRVLELGMRLSARKQKNLYCWDPLLGNNW